VDNPFALEALCNFVPPEESAHNSEKPWSIYLQVDCGGHRCGVDPKGNANYMTYLI
jgi:D-serine deaminase-like pyridoxal phosphate-dependent protein